MIDSIRERGGGGGGGSETEREKERERNLVFYALSTITVISGQWLREREGWAGGRRRRRRRRTEKKEEEEEKKRLVSPVTVWSLNWLSLSQRPLTPVTDQSSHKMTSIPPVNEHWHTKNIQTRQSNAAQTGSRKSLLSQRRLPAINSADFSYRIQFPAISPISALLDKCSPRQCWRHSLNWAH